MTVADAIRLSATGRILVERREGPTLIRKPKMNEGEWGVTIRRCWTRLCGVKVLPQPNGAPPIYVFRTWE